MSVCVGVYVWVCGCWGGGGGGGEQKCGDRLTDWLLKEHC